MTNGYCKIIIESKEVGLKFAWPGVTEFFVEASKRKDIYYTGDDDQMTDYGLGRLLFCAYKNNCLLKDVDPVLEFGDFVDWVEEKTATEGDTSVTDVWKCFAESTVVKKIKDNQKKNQESESTSENTSTT